MSLCVFKSKLTSLSKSGGYGHTEDRKFVSFITKLDVFRHIKCLHEVAAKKYGLSPGSHSYGYSVNYSFYPPILGVFKIKGEPSEKDEDLTEEMERLKEQARRRGGEPFLIKTMFAVGKNVISRTAGSVEPGKAPLWTSESGLSKSITSRPPGVDVDGKELQASPDMTDIVLARFPLEMRSGDKLYKYWKGAGTNCSVGNATLATMLLQTLETMYSVAGYVP